MMVWFVLFLLSGAFILYILFGYPVLLYVLSRRENPVRRQPSAQRVAMLIAVHNGQDFIANKLRSIRALNYPADHIEVVIACDGCTDGTAAVVEQFAGAGIRLLQLPRKGKAAALNEAMKVASSEILVFTDVRQTFDPDCLNYLLEGFADPSVGAISARLVIQEGQSQEEADVGLYWGYEFWVRRQLSRLDSFFGATGACYALRRELAVPIPQGTLLDDMYEPLAAFFRGYRLVVDERAKVFDLPTDLDTEFHRKVRTLAGNYQILAAYPALLGPRNRLWFHYVSYKFGRLMLPFAAIAMSVSSFGLPYPWFVIAGCMQVAAFALAAVDPLVSNKWPFKRLTSILRTFIVMIAAAVYATRIWFGPPSEDLWKHNRSAIPKT